MLPAIATFACLLLLSSLTLIGFGFYNLFVSYGLIVLLSTLSIFTAIIIVLVTLIILFLRRAQTDLKTFALKVVDKIKTFINKIPKPVLKILLKLLKKSK